VPIGSDHQVTVGVGEEVEHDEAGVSPIKDVVLPILLHRLLLFDAKRTS
jgi:hypothetical protein